jgi:two-component system response regulator LytT
MTPEERQRGVPPTKRLRALVLEDELPARNLLVRLLEATHLAEVVGAVSSIGEARQVLETRSVDVVFVDVLLSCGEDGLDFIHSCRPVAGGPTHPPFFVLATAFQRYTMQAFKLGVVDYLLKPFSEERVERCLRRLLGLLANATGPGSA